MAQPGPPPGGPDLPRDLGPGLALLSSGAILGGLFLVVVLSLKLAKRDVPRLGK